jgi:hypothetical protein
MLTVSCLIWMLSPGGAFGEQANNNLLLDGSYIRFNYDGATPEVSIRIPYVEKVFRIQGGDDTRFPLGNYYDVKVPFSYQMTKRLSFQVIPSIERIYSLQSPFDIMTQGQGIPLNSMFGVGSTQSTQQFLCVFGLKFGF